MIQYSAAALSTLSASIEGLVSDCKRLAERKQMNLASEALSEIIELIYLLKKGALPYEGLTSSAAGVGIELDAAEEEFLKSLEKAMRREEDYIEWCSSASGDSLQAVLSKLKKAV